MSTARTDRSLSRRSPQVSDDHRRAIRKLSRNGNSLTVAVPPEFVSAMFVLPGDDLELVYDAEWEGVFIHALRPRTFRPIGVERRSGDRG